MDLTAAGTKNIAGEGGGTSPSDSFSQYAILRSSANPAQGTDYTTTAGTAQNVSGGSRPPNGFLISNNGAVPLMVNDISTASATSGIQVPPGAVFITPPHYSPGGPVSVWCATAGQPFTYRGW